MKKILLALVCIVAMTASAQHYGIKYLRYDEDFSYLKDSTQRSPYERLKYIPLHNDNTAWLTLGGELRYQYQLFENEEWGEVPEDRDGFILIRNLFHADLRTKSGFRLFTQLKSNGIKSREVPPKRIDVNDFDVHQLFVEYRFPTTKGEWGARIGRQEIRLGSQRLVTVREGPNNRLSFDGARAFFRAANATWDAFYLHPAFDQPGILDDRFNDNNKLYGLYGVLKEPKWLNHLDLYYIGTYNRTAVFNADADTESRHSFGARVWNNGEVWMYDVEGVVQAGRFGDQDIFAYTLSIHTSYTAVNLKGRPTFGLKTEVISGDDDPADCKLHTFNPLYPRGAYFGLAALIGPANLLDVHPYLNLDLTKDLTFALDYDWFWRYSIHDNIYGPNVRPLYTAASSKRFIGGQLGAEVAYEVSQFLNLTLEGTWFDTGAYVADVSPGEDIWFTAFTLQFKY